MDYVKLSKTISRALRHAPDDYGLSLDAGGWAAVDELLTILRRREYWADLQEADLHAMLAQSEKKRYEIADGRIRALYGHSIEQKIQKQAFQPPAVLFHGTVEQALPAIRDEGLRAMRRQYVHLSSDPATARRVGSRHGKSVRILEVRALEAHAAGVRFYPELNGIWLADSVPARFLKEG